MSDPDDVLKTSKHHDLCTRIAAVIRREVPCHPPAADRIADAVIAELKNDPSIMFMTHVCEEGCTCD